MGKKLSKSLFIVVLSILMLFSGSLSVNCEETGSITVTVISQDDDNGTRVDRPISGVYFNVYKVWSYDDTNVLLSDPFSSSGVVINANMSEDEIQKTAPKFVEMVADLDPDYVIGPTDSKGVIKRENLTKGGYLFIQKDPIVWHGKQYTMAPFLVTVPRLVDGEYVMDVNAHPKPSLKRSWSYEPPKTGIE